MIFCRQSIMTSQPQINLSIRWRSAHLSLLLLAMLWIGPPAHGQQASPSVESAAASTENDDGEESFAEPPRSRTEIIEAERARRSTELEPEEPGVWEQRLILVKDQQILERISEGIAGFRLKFGGMAPGAGFALGPEYYRVDLAKGNVSFRGAAQASFTGAQKLDLEVMAPRLAGDRAELRFQSVRHVYPRMNFYGSGGDSALTGRSNFQLEDTAVDTEVVWKPDPRFRAGASAGYLFVNTGPGNNDRLISTEQQFSPQQAPGIDRQTNFFRTGGFAQVDYRDNPGGPRAGGSYTVQYNIYQDTQINQFDFRRLTFDIQQYFPFFNKRRVIAVRARTQNTFTRHDQQVPFYLQSVLGGNSDLRGFRPFRFYGDNSMLLNAEWRWEVFSGMDMALFGDAGKVYQQADAVNFDQLQTAAGFGMRFNARNNTFLRLDIGFSREGYQVWFAFGDGFAPALQRGSSNLTVQ
jgi:outer membrane protein assembly factor BamA